MRKRSGFLWFLLMAALFLAVPAILFSTVPGTFTPPPPGSPEAAIPALPYGAPEAVGVDTAANGSSNGELSAGVSNEEASAGGAKDAVDSLVAGFYQRNPGKPDLPEWAYSGSGVRKDFIDMAYAALKGTDVHNTFMQFVHFPDPNVRMEAIRSLGAARNGMSQDGASAEVTYLARQSGDDLRALVRAATETILQDTEDGSISSAQMLLLFLGEYGKSAIPHLSWVARNHPEADMRVFARNCAISLDPGATGASALLFEGIADPSGNVRLNALQRLLFYPLEIASRNRGQLPPWYLETRPGDTYAHGAPQELPPVPAVDGLEKLG